LLNWLKGEPDGLRALQERAELVIEAEAGRVARLSHYIERNATISEDWKASVRDNLLTE
jgi:hypothetical protein